MLQNTQETPIRAEFGLGKYVTITKNSSNNSRSAKVENCIHLGFLSECRAQYYSQFKSYEPRAGAFILIDLGTGQQFVGSGESILAELEQLAASHTKRASERSAIEKAIVKSGTNMVLVQVVPLPAEEASEFQELEADIIRGCQPQFNRFVDFLPGDAVEVTLHSESGSYGPEDEITVAVFNRTRNSGKEYPSIAAAEKVFMNSPKWFLRRAAEHGGEPFEMRVSDAGQLELNLEPGAAPADCSDDESDDYDDDGPDLHLLSDDPTDPDWWMSGDSLCFALNPAGEMMILNSFRRLYRLYKSPLIASVQLEISPKTFARLVEKHNADRHFTLTVDEINDLRRARYNELKRAAARK